MLIPKLNWIIKRHFNLLSTIIHLELGKTLNKCKTFNIILTNFNCSQLKNNLNSLDWVLETFLQSSTNFFLCLVFFHFNALTMLGSIDSTQKQFLKLTLYIFIMRCFKIPISKIFKIIDKQKQYYLT